MIKDILIWAGLSVPLYAAGKLIHFWCLLKEDMINTGITTGKKLSSVLMVLVYIIYIIAMPATLIIYSVHTLYTERVLNHNLCDLKRVRELARLESASEEERCKYFGLSINDKYDTMHAIKQEYEILGLNSLIRYNKHYPHRDNFVKYSFDDYMHYVIRRGGNNKE